MDRKRGVLGAAAVVSATVLLAAIWQRRRKAKKFAASNKLVSSRGERLNLPGLARTKLISTVVSSRLHQRPWAQPRMPNPLPLV